MGRVSLTSDVLGDDDRGVEPRPSAAAGSEVRRRQRRPKVKFTALLDAQEAGQLVDLAGQVVDALAPDPVGKGWQAEVVRGLVALASEDVDLRKRLVSHLAERHGLDETA